VDKETEDGRDEGMKEEKDVQERKGRSGEGET
jgi:hypothetical protein